MTMTAFPVLPQGWQRSQLEALLIEIAPALRIGKRLSLLLYMMNMTRPRDWTSRDSEPVFYAPQTDTALALGKTTRAVRNDERTLAQDLGMIELRTKANGSRNFYGRCGIVFSRLIDMVPDLIELRDRLRADRTRTRELVHIRSSYLRHMKKAFVAIPLDHPERSALLAAFGSWPESGALRSLGIERLEAHVVEARDLCTTADDILDSCNKTSCEPAENFRSLIQEDTKENPTDLCNENVDGRTSDKSEDLDLFDATPSGAAMGFGKKPGAASAARKAQMVRLLLAPDQLYRLAGESMQAFIEVRRTGRDSIRELDIIEAAHDLLPHLGVNYSAWEDAASTMGDAGAALCILLLDANRDHPTTPVVNPGGALRAMTRKFRENKLNLTGSLIGLSRRRGQ